MSFSIPATTQTFKFWEAVNPEPLAAPMTFVESPMSATLTIGVALRIPCTHSL